MSEFRLPGQPSTSASAGRRRRLKINSGYTIGSNNIVMHAGGWDINGNINGTTENEAEESEIQFQEASEAFEAIKDALKYEEAVENMRERVARAVQRANEAKDIGQVGLSQDLMEEAAGWMIEQQLRAMGYGKWIENEMVLKVVASTAGEAKLDVTSLRKFPRVIPNDVQAIIKTTKDLFTGYVIVFTNPEEHKVRDRDPILFGQMQAFPDRLYYLVDWIDEYCGLTMEKFCALGEVHPGWAVNEVMDEPTDEDVERLLRYVKTGKHDESEDEPGLLRRWWRRLIREYVN